MMEFRIKVLLTQCNSQLERAQQTVDFNRQWKNLLTNLERSIANYHHQLDSIRNEPNSSVNLDTIQVKHQRRMEFLFFNCLFCLLNRISNKLDSNVNKT